MTLPLDIIATIARLLCAHCQQPGSFPTADFEDARVNKRTLARLCRVSRHFYAGASPVLYHSYATGNLLLQRDADMPFARRARPDYLLQFASTLAARPDLAHHLVAVQLTPVRVCAWLDDLTQHPGIPPKLVPAITPIREKYVAQMQQKPYDFAVTWHSWLYLLTHLCPRLTTALLDVSHQPNGRIQGGYHIKFPDVRTLGLITAERGRACGQLIHLRPAFCNAEHIYLHGSPNKILFASNFAARAPLHASASSGSRRPITRLTSAGIKPGVLTTALSCTPDLEWLECYSQPAKLSTRRTDFPGGTRWPFSALRGLCLTWAPYMRNEKDPYREIPEQLGRAWRVRDLTGLEALEHLSVDCWSLLPWNSTASEEEVRGMFVRLLPRGIRTLRVSHVDKSLLQPMRTLAEAAPGEFPRLEKVGVGLSESEVERGVRHIAETMDAASLFRSKLIDFGWTVDCGSPSMAALDSATADGWPVPEFPLTLEGPEWRFCDGDGPGIVDWDEVLSVWHSLRDMTSDSPGVPSRNN